MNIRHRVAAVIIRDNKILLVKGKGWQELWTPGGKIEEEEGEEDTLRRELKEELELSLSSMKFFKKYFMENPYSKGNMTETKCFLVKVKGEPKPDQEIESFIGYSLKDFKSKKYKMIEENEKGLIPDLIKEKLLT